MDTIQTSEKVSYFKDCLDRLKRQEKKNKPAIIATKYILTMSILRMRPSGLLFSIIQFIADIETVLKTGLAELQRRK